MINITLLIQIVHFWIAYLIMTRILLRPVSTRIIQEQESARTLEKSVEHTAQLIANTVTLNKQHWRALQQQLQARQPIRVIQSLPSELIRRETATPETMMPTFSAQELAPIIEQLQKRIVQHITHEVDGHARAHHKVGSS